MKASRWFLLAALLTGVMLGSARAQDDDEIVTAEADVPDGVEVLTRGPIHEAFAMPVTGEVKPTDMVLKEPPADIDEVPPDFKPEGDDVVWIPGYWSWDDERDDFIWVSGVWRKTPPKQRWVPGYWEKAGEGWRWTSGFWTPIAEEAITYYDPPPETLEAGPTSEAPGDNYFWTPGVWNYADTGYRWRPGYWAVSQPNWIWVPDRWCWTPSGAVFIPGFWDFTLAMRGCAFSPVYINRTVYTQPTWRPQFALNTAALSVNFFVRPNNCHYYFGDYYAANYGQRGYLPMASYWGRRGGWGWDPIVAYNQAYYRSRGVNYVNRMNDWHRFYVDHPDRRPPRTWRDQVNIVNNKKVTVNNITNITNVNHIVDNDINVIDNSANIVALPVDKVARAKRNDPDLKFAKVDDRQRDLAKERAQQIRKVNQERIKAERDNAVAARDRQPKPGADPKQAQVRNKVKLPAVAKTGDDTPGRDRPGRDNTAGRGDKPGTRPKPIVDPPAPRPKGNDDRPDVSKERPTPKPETRPKLVVDPPAPKPNGTGGRPAPPTERPTPKPETRPKLVVDPPAPKPNGTGGRPAPPTERPTPKPETRPKLVVDPPAPKPNGTGGRPAPPTERPTPKPETRPKFVVDPPAPKPNGTGGRPVPPTERPTPRLGAGPEPRRTAKPEVRNEPLPQPKPEARPQPRPEPRPQPKVEPRPQPRPQPKPEVRPQSRPQPRPMPKSEARPQQQPRPQPRVEPRPKPKPEARPPAAAKPGGGNKGKGKDKDKK